MCNVIGCATHGTRAPVVCVDAPGTEGVATHGDESSDGSLEADGTDVLCIWFVGCDVYGELYRQRDSLLFRVVLFQLRSRLVDGVGLSKVGDECDECARESTVVPDVRERLGKYLFIVLYVSDRLLELVDCV